MDTFYRVGTKQPRNVYRVDDEHPEGEYIGVFFTDADAAASTSALNCCLRMQVLGGDGEGVESSC